MAKTGLFSDEFAFALGRKTIPEPDAKRRTGGLYRRFDALYRLFQIPMRGNEAGVSARRWLSIRAFQIPMRGNEKSHRLPSFQPVLVSNPHEG